MCPSLRVLHLADSWEGGGAESVFRDTVAASERIGAETYVMVSEGKRSPLTYVFSLRSARKLKSALHEFRPHVIHLQNYYHFLSPSVLWAIRSYRRGRGGEAAPLKVVFTAHDFHLIAPNSGFQHFRDGRAVNLTAEEVPVKLNQRVWDGRSRILSTLKLLQFWLAYRRLGLQEEIDLVLSPSHFLADLLRQAYPELPVEVVRNPSPLPISSGELQARKVERSSEPIRLCFAGRVTPEKGVAEFIGTLSKTKLRERIEFHLYGTGESLDTIRSAAQASSVSLVEHGYVAPEQLGNELALNDILVLPSLVPESASLVLIEAAGVGLPTLTWPNGGKKEISELTSVSIAADLADPKIVEASILSLLQRAGQNEVLDPEEFTFERFDERLREAYTHANRPE